MAAGGAGTAAAPKGAGSSGAFGAGDGTAGGAILVNGEGAIGGRCGATCFGRGGDFGECFRGGRRGSGDLGVAFEYGGGLVERVRAGVVDDGLPLGGGGVDGLEDEPGEAAKDEEEESGDGGFGLPPGAAGGDELIDVVE